MRTVSGAITMPSDAPDARVEIVVELRDTSVSDAPSTIIAQTRLQNVEIKPGKDIPFQFQAPEVASGRTLSLRVHVPFAATDRVSPGDFLTTAAHPVPSTGEVRGIRVAVKVV